MKLKSALIATAVAGALGFGAIGLGAGEAQAKPLYPNPPVPGPGHGEIVPPGQVAHLPFVPPPGHWSKPWR